MKTILQSALIAFVVIARASAQDLESGIKVKERGNEYEHKWALVVGINYDGAGNVQVLKNAENDASAIGRLLRDAYGFECEILQGKDATASAIKGRLTKYEKVVGEKDCFLFYFAGHGKPRGDMPLLYPADVEVDGLVANTLQASEVIRLEIKALHSLYIFDSCYSGQITNLDRFPPLLDQTKPRGGDSKFESRCIQILTSSADNQTAKDGVNGRSPFAHSLETGFQQQHELQTNDRISVSELHTFIEKTLKGQSSHLLSLRDTNAATGGEFYFIGKGPPSPPTKSLVFQTLPGTYATFPGSPLSKSWFDEMPWMTPAMRLVADGDYEAVVGQFDGGNAPESALFIDPNRLAKSLLHSETATIDESARETALKLESLKTLNGAEYLRVLDDVLASLNTRATRSSATDLHMGALIESARLKRLRSKPEDQVLVDLHNRFKKSAEAYGLDQKTGLQARCMADHAHWLLEMCPKDLLNETQDESRYKLAIKYFEEAINQVSESPGTEHFRIELHAGAAYSWRQRAKSLVADQLDLNTEVYKVRNRREATAAWKIAADHYEEALDVAVKSKLPETDPVFGYLNQRIGWLRMDLWDVKAASDYFSRATANSQSDSPEFVDFLSHASSSQGLAMAKRLGGICAKGDLVAVQNRLLKRIETSRAGETEWSLLQERLGNVTERVAECDFLVGRAGLIEASTEFKRGLQFCDRWRESVATRAAEESVDKQELRFLCKLIVTSAILDDEQSRKRYDKRFRNLDEVQSEASGVVKVLCELANAFSEYGQARFENGRIEDLQVSLDKIRTIVRQNATAALDREPAELLLAIASVLSEEQQRLDAKIRLNLLPKDPSGRPPKSMPEAVRKQYDDVIVMQGRTYSGKVPAVEFESFRQLVRDVRQSKWTNEDMLEPFAMFFFPLDGSDGLLLVSFGDNDAQQRGGEVYGVGFGWKLVPKEITESITSILNNATRENPKLMIGWSDDEFLSAAGFDTPVPFTTTVEQK